MNAFTQKSTLSSSQLISSCTYLDFPRPRSLTTTTKPSNNTPSATTAKETTTPPTEPPLEPIPQSWSNVPSWIVPYLRLARLDRPAGTYLLYLPCTWSIAMATYAFGGDAGTVIVLLKNLTLFGVGAFVMRGAGCTINDMWDRDFDKKVDRTRNRPLASGQITYFQALVFLGMQLSVGLAVLTQLNLYSILLGASSLVLVVTYPLMKRITYWPQAFLGLTFNWGALLGWSAVAGVCDWGVCLPLYVAGWSWTMVYDTIYAIQDKSDDVKAGVKSTALRFSANMKPWLGTFATLSVAAFSLAGAMNGQGIAYQAIAVGGAALHYIWLIGGLNEASRVDAARRFRASRWLGWIVFGGVLADLVVKWSGAGKGEKEVGKGTGEDEKKSNGDVVKT
ncbi:Para-hydroxybenzoate--polyprenyltransferase, mitochondrial precursor (PHB:polyprenyltransferase) [Blyttiomyces sp. JEL0837]|nr:Para-hydroxybenzoate--polyprenyltransferase, mitochondrial precursor (PHB:polyprenyltransferase) [Blyttiomyces sp. JEL0837]